MSLLADEPLFQRLLSLERRRCERTGGYFALLLIDTEELTLPPAFMEQIGCGIASAMRETDITGWYRRESIIGVILTTLNADGLHNLEPLMLERLNAILSAQLDERQARQVRISCHIFPEEGLSNQIFYSDNPQKRHKKKSPALIKRAIDLAGSVSALLLLSPVFLIIALAIKMTSPGPVFFRQRRIGQFGREFTFLKFRSMYANCDPAIHQEFIRNLIEKNASHSAGTYKIKNDPRVTRIGSFLRKSSLDELPQFINVLAGEMSLVGPRPPIPYEFESYSLWHRRRIVEAKPGITGAWQVYGRSRTSFDEMVRMDLRYIQNQSIWLDLKILIKTPFAVFSGNGAY